MVSPNELDEVPRCWRCLRPLSALSARLGVCVSCVSKAVHAEGQDDGTVPSPGYSFNVVDDDAESTQSDRSPDFPDISNG